MRLVLFVTVSLLLGLFLGSVHSFSTTVTTKQHQQQLLSLVANRCDEEGKRCRRFSFTKLHTAPPRRVYEGSPSNPGWKRGQLPNNQLTDWAVTHEANRPVICEYEPDTLWLWTKWRGTVLSMVYVPVLWNVLVGIGIDIGVHAASDNYWSLLAKPPVDDPIIEQLQGLNSLWGYQVTLCTFVLTFFTAEAYKHWRAVYFTTRAIQGRINDICMLVTIGAKNNNIISNDNNNNNSNDPQAGEEEEEDLVTRITRLIRLSHTFFWAATPTCSNGVGDGGVRDGDDADDLPREFRRDNAIGPLLLSKDGLFGLVQVGELTRQEADALLESGISPSQYAYILMEWVGLLVMDGLESGRLGNNNKNCNNSGLEENILRQLSALRGEYFNIGDYAAGRMPLAYVQLVQVLVDSLVLLAPFSLYPEIGSLSIPLSASLTMFFKGLLELSKSFLDPFGNEGYPGQNIRVDVLVSELNFGAASRWVKAANAFPSSTLMSSSSTKPPPPPPTLTN
jgi:hypothetical protein